MVCTSSARPPDRGGTGLIYTVFSTSDSPYMQWQSEFLEYSWKQVGQPGELIRLVSSHRPTVPEHRYARSVGSPSWRIHPVTGDRYPPYNKMASLLHWLRTERPDGTVLLLDPDCVFTAPIRREVAEGHPVGQKWIGIGHDRRPGGFGLGQRFDFLEDHGVRPRIRAQLAMIPTLIHTSDLR